MKRASRRPAALFVSKRNLQTANALRRAAVEVLEPRRFLSGSVTATVDHGNLTILGDAEANAIVVDQTGLAAGEVRILGTGGTTVNDQSAAVVLTGITRGVGIRTGAGDDTVTVRDINLPGTLWINADGGANTVALDNVDVAQSLHITNESNVGVTVTIDDTTVGKHFRMETLGGGLNATIRALEVQAKTDIGSGNGDDTVLIDDSTFHGRAYLYTGKGDDVIEIDANGSPSGAPTTFDALVSVSMKQGDDSLQLGVAGESGNSVVFSGKAKLRGGKGTDTLLAGDLDLTDGRFRVKEFEDNTSTPDTTAPTVSSTNPADDATGVARNKKITATFSEPMNAATIVAANVTLTGPGAAVVTGSVDYIGTTMTFTPADALAADTEYTLTITTGATDVAGNALAADDVTTFTTGTTLDTTAPTVSSTSPADDETGVAFNKKIAATFNEPMDPLTLTNSTVTVTGAGGANVAGSIGYAGSTMTFTPTNPLAANTVFTATITTGAEDLAGNALASNFVWNFTTGATADTTRPTVTSTDPTDLKTNVAINKTIAAVFNESMDALTITGKFKLTGPGNANVAGLVEYDAATKTATFNPSSNLAPSTTYTATITGGNNGVEDSAGNALLSDKVWTFTTGTQIAQAPIELGRAAPFAVMATASISGTANDINGDVGLSPGTAQGFPPSEVNGSIHVNDQTIIDAQTDLLAAYNDAVSRTVTSQSLPGNMGGLTFTPGLYTNSTSVLISGAGPLNNVTLDAQGDANAIFIFKMGSTLTTGPGAQVILAGGAKADNIFWQVGTSATLDTTTQFKGNILAAVTITVNTGSDVVGRLLAGSNSDGSVTVNASTVTVPT
ncbi:MAG: hypothetical protein QOF78_2888 [Phycisphaerales bacterium]|jgi:methionine-rich copper-binding protein CopC|nr:hypothetical protein [Phycisphaerales bacterium]